MTLSATMKPLAFSLARKTLPKFPLPSVLPISKSSNVQCFISLAVTVSIGSSVAKFSTVLLTIACVHLILVSFG